LLKPFQLTKLNPETFYIKNETENKHHDVKSKERNIISPEQKGNANNLQ
jgi:hypothetical protein